MGENKEKTCKNGRKEGKGRGKKCGEKVKTKDDDVIPTRTNCCKTGEKEKKRGRRNVGNWRKEGERKKGKRRKEKGNR